MNHCPGCSRELPEPVLICPDCGYRFRKPRPKKEQGPLTLRQRYQFTVLLVLSYIAFSQIPIYTYPNAYSGGGDTTISTVKLFAIGLTPIFSGYFLIELLSLVVKPFSNWRQNGQAGRNKLNASAFTLSLVIAILESTGYVLMLNRIDQSHSLLQGVGFALPYKPVLGILLFFGTLTALVIIQSTTRVGITNGYILYFFLHVVYKFGAILTTPFLSSNRQSGIEYTFDEKMNVFYLIIFVLAVVLLALKHLPSLKKSLVGLCWNRPRMIYQTETAEYPVQGSPLPQTNYPGFGLFYTIVLLIQTASGSTGHFQQYHRTIMNIAYTADYLFAALFLGWLFTRRFWTDHQLENRAVLKTNQGDSRRFFLFWFIAGLTWFLCDRFSGELIAHQHPLINLFVEITDPLQWFVLLILGREITENLDFTRHNQNLICLAEMDNVSMVQLWTSQFDRLKINHHMEGLRYRQIKQFISPYVKIRVWVEPSQAKKALRVMALNRLKQV